MIQLCSASIRRIDILKKFKISFFNIKSTLKQEPRYTSGKIKSYVRNLAKLKGNAAIAQTQDWILTADTIVVLDNIVFYKPKSFLEAIGMLKLLSGQTHQVITGICFTSPKTHVQISRTVSTFITFPDLTESSIKKYVYENNPLDKAGGYGIQDVPAHFISYQKGCYFNVMGLPIYALLRLAKQYDIILN